MRKVAIWCCVLGLFVTCQANASSGPDPNYTLKVGSGECLGGETLVIVTHQPQVMQSFNHVTDLSCLSGKSS